MTTAIHVYNASRSRIKVQCYKKGSKTKLGDHFWIGKESYRKVNSTDDWFSSKLDLCIGRYESITLLNGNQEPIKIEEATFRTGNDTSWIVKDDLIVEQKHSESLHVEKPDGIQHAWNCSAKKITLKDIKYEKLPAEPQKWKPEGAVFAKIRNANERVATLKTELKSSFTESHTWSKNAGIKVSLATEVKASIPFLVDKKIKMGVEGSYAYTWGGSSKESKTWSESVTVEVSPRHQVEVSGKTMKGFITVPYTAKFSMEYEGTSEKIEKKIKGVYEGVCAKKLVLWVEPEEPLSKNYVSDTDSVSTALVSGSKAQARKLEDEIVHSIVMKPGERVELQYDDINKTVVG